MARPEHPNTDKAEENNHKNNFIKIIEAFIKEMRNSLKEVEEKTNKKLEEIRYEPKLKTSVLEPK